MLLCGIHDVKPGAVLGAVVCDPQNPNHELLRPGVAMDATLLASLRRRGVTQLWLDDDLTRDLDSAVGAQLTGARVNLYSKLRDGLAASAQKSLTATSVHAYRQSVLQLVVQVISSMQYAAMTDAMFSAPGQATHGTNVAYLSLLTALHIEEYVVTQQSKLRRDLARDMSVLGLAGLLHDLGKARLTPEAAAFHDIHADESHPQPEGYAEHITLGQKLLRDSRAPARVVNAVLNHHQRFDGNGWPDMTKLTAGRISGPLAGTQVHIFARIVAAANVLDNLLSDVSGARRPPVAALHAFASAQFDGWFDPTVRRAMLLRIPPFAVGTDIRLNDGRRGVVTAPSLAEPCRPVVRLRPADEDGAHGLAETVDLAMTPGLSITHALGEDVSGYLYVPPPVFHDAIDGRGP